MPSLRHPTVPKRWPCSQTASAHGRTSRSTTSGRASVVTSTSSVSSSRTVRSRNASRTLPAHEVALVAGVGEQARELLQRRRLVEQRAQAGRERGHRLHSRRHRARAARTTSLRSLAAIPRTDERAPLPSPPWTVHPTARGWAATSPRSPSSRSTHASAWCGSTRSAPGGRGAGVLCGTHADRMSPPRGWNLLDRRGVESRLWIGRAAPHRRRPTRAVDAGDASARPAPRPLSAPAAPLLPFDTAVARDPEPPAPAPEHRRRHAPVVAARPSRARSSSTCSTPARRCSRARFEGARPVDDESRRSSARGGRRGGRPRRGGSARRRSARGCGRPPRSRSRSARSSEKRISPGALACATASVRSTRPLR